MYINSLWLCTYHFSESCPLTNFFSRFLQTTLYVTLGSGHSSFTGILTIVDIVFDPNEIYPLFMVFLIKWRTFVWDAPLMWTLRLVLGCPQ